MEWQEETPSISPLHQTSQPKDTSVDTGDQNELKILEPIIPADVLTLSTDPPDTLRTPDPPHSDVTFDDSPMMIEKTASLDMQTMSSSHNINNGSDPDVGETRKKEEDVLRLVCETEKPSMTLSLKPELLGRHLCPKLTLGLACQIFQVRHCPILFL